MEEYIEQPYIVYAKHDAENRIIDVNSSAFLDDVSGWVEIDSGYTQRHHHAQGNYFEKPIMDDRGIYRYLYTPEDETLWRERTQEEMDADWHAPAQQPTLEERVVVLEEKVCIEMEDREAALKLLGVSV